MNALLPLLVGSSIMSDMISGTFITSLVYVSKSFFVKGGSKSPINTHDFLLGMTQIGLGEPICMEVSSSAGEPDGFNSDGCSDWSWSC